MNILIKKIIIIIIINSFVYSNDIIEIKELSLMDKIAQMIMVRVNGEFYNNEQWRKKNVIKLIE